MLVVAGLAFAGAPYFVALVGAVILAISTLQEYAHLQPRFARAGAIRLMAGGVFLAAVTGLAFASLCFAIGRLFAWLISP
jgi:ABC-type cobalamin transport system permease subunit